MTRQISRLGYALLMLGLIVPGLALGQDTPKNDPVKPVEGQDQIDRVETARFAIEAVGEAIQDPAKPSADKPKAREEGTKIEEYRVTPSTRTSLTPSRVFRTTTRAVNPDALEANFGLKLLEADDTLRTQLAIPAGQGVVIVAVKGGSLAEQAGLKVNDILLKLAEKSVSNPEEAAKTFLDLKQEALAVKLIREGKPRQLHLVGPEHGLKPESAEYWIGTPVSPIDATLRTHLPSLKADAGLIVNDVVKESPAAAAGVLKNDLLVTMDGKPLKNADSLIAQIQASQGKPVPLEIVRGGKALTLTVTPVKRAHPTFVNVTTNKVGSGQSFLMVQPRILLDGQPIDSTTRGQFVRDLSTPAQASKPGESSFSVPLQVTGRLSRAEEPSTAKIEALLKQLDAKIEALSKSVEGLKKAEGK